jgi:hypothetical protein
MTRRCVCAMVAAALAGATLSGCSGSKECAGDACASFGDGTAKVLINQFDESITGKIMCASEGGDKLTISVQSPGTSRVNVDLAGSNVEDLLIVKDDVMGNSTADGDVTMTKNGSHYSFAGNSVQSGRVPAAVTLDVTCQ